MCASEITGGSDGDDWRMMNGQLMGEYGWWWRWWSKWWSGWWWCCMVNCDEWWVIQPQHHSLQFIAVAPMNPGFHSRAYIRRTSTTRLERDCGKFGNNRRQRRFGSVVVGPIFVVFPCQQLNHCSSLLLLILTHCLLEGYPESRPHVFFSATLVKLPGPMGSYPK